MVKHPPKDRNTLFIFLKAASLVAVHQDCRGGGAFDLTVWGAGAQHEVHEEERVVRGLAGLAHQDGLAV